MDKFLQQWLAPAILVVAAGCGSKVEESGADIPETVMTAIKKSLKGPEAGGRSRSRVIRRGYANGVEIAIDPNYMGEEGLRMDMSTRGVRDVDYEGHPKPNIAVRCKDYGADGLAVMCEGQRFFADGRKTLYETIDGRLWGRRLAEMYSGGNPFVRKKKR